MSKSNRMSRRKFMATSLAASAGLVTGLNGFSPEPQQRKSDMKVGLYSITLLGIWFRGEGATLEEVIRVAKSSGFDGVEFDGKRPHANPLDCPTKKCRELKAFAEDQGVPIYGVAATGIQGKPDSLCKRPCQDDFRYGSQNTQALPGMAGSNKTSAAGTV